MSRMLPESYPIYDTVYGNEIPTEQYYVIIFDSIASKYWDNSKHYDPNVIDLIKSFGFVEENKIYVHNKRHDSSSQTLYVNRDLRIFIRVYNSRDGVTRETKTDLVQMDFTYDIKLGELTDQFDYNELNSFVRTKKKASIQLVKSDMGHLDTEDYDLVVPPMDLEMNYGEDFIKVHETIIERLNKSHDKGIILLHGDPGTGKTSYIKHLTGLITDKDILFIPPSMAEMLSEPTIIPFLMDHKNSILIIEDAERVISDREGNGSPAGVSNILNLTDGILGDCLNIQVVATFNMKREKIDQALLRKGRLIAEHKFEKLSVEETNKLLKYLNKEEIVEEGMVLADIYNIDVELFKSSNKKTSKLGF